jgi:hypothetical protein
MMPNTDDVEKIITDFTVPTSLIPIRKRKREPAKPPKLRRRRFGIWYRLIEKAIFDTKTNAMVIDPPIKDFICIILIIGVPFFNIILLMLLSKAQNMAALMINMFPIKWLLWKISELSVFALRIIVQ